ncbi:ThiF family adenylyltransferase [Neisseria sp. 83E34]|uniref:tRNA threonylcarbamoyladenosine dehydratase n=1 Tax=Neisseria sp. 83E34 TaxID=1692264 RepID=UPI0006CE8E9F|nr:tRNA threonylcarbamoyladenosine dehydratase [Neisseria sp. 83E34]KPN70642.1 heme biosynthesis protein HemY [Neisseria sp. 83E34]
MIDQSSLFSRRFGGIARLYGHAALQHFAGAHVCVVGVGGVGSWAVEALARSGIGHLTLIDLDNVAESNVNRQLPALTSEFGKAKVSSLHERILQINPACKVTEIEDFVTEDNLAELFGSGFDFVIDAIDQIRVKAAMADYFVKHKQPFILSGGAGGQKNPALIQTADLSRVTHDPLLANLRYTLRKRYGFTRDTQKTMRVPCVFSTENITPPQAGEVCETGSVPQGLSCAGYGASMLVTASFGLYCAQAAIDYLAKQCLSENITNP